MGRAFLFLPTTNTRTHVSPPPYIATFCLPFFLFKCRIKYCFIKRPIDFSSSFPVHNSCHLTLLEPVIKLYFTFFSYIISYNCLILVNINYNTLTICFILVCLPISKAVFKASVLGAEILSLTYSSNFLEVDISKEVGKIGQLTSY